MYFLSNLHFESPLPATKALSFFILPAEFLFLSGVSFIPGAAELVYVAAFPPFLKNFFLIRKRRGSCINCCIQSAYPEWRFYWNLLRPILKLGVRIARGQHFVADPLQGKGAVSIALEINFRFIC
ncbi:hypothetical protein CDAR_94691 [Caerostris darwini]|uniref:Uncharacterized protein n=1 Tax=Caerostris darwini TaxID=1538125 RepID=A0AAV4P1U5_9ARAC|nr:hypothetical protein CDAR_94691 [Caerostris darwini]